MQEVISNIWFRVVAGTVLALSLLIAFNWPTVTLMSAIVSSERRPALLSDASWNEPDSAVRFYERFGGNTKGDDLVSWLERYEFEIDRQAQTANKRNYSLPCNEYIDVTWTLNDAGSIAELEAVISGGGCL